MKFRYRLGLCLVLTLFVLGMSSTAQAATSADYYRAGLQLYNARNYSQAVLYFGAAISLDPNNMSAYQGRANCEYALGNKQAALADYQKVQSVQPNPQLAQFILALQAQLTAPPPLPVTAAVAVAPAIKRDITFKSKFDVRVTLGASMMTLTDFKNNASDLYAEGQYFQGQGNSTSYTGNVPDGILPQFGVEVSQRFTPDFEGGLFFNYLPVGTTTNDFEIPAGVPVTQKDSYNISAFAVGAQGRYTFSHGDFRPFFAAGVMGVPMQIAFSSTDYYVNSTFHYETDTTNGTFTAVGIGGMAELGLDWDLGDGFVVSPSVGYQFASASNFQAAVQSSSGSASQGQTVTLNVVQTDFGSAIEPVSNGKLMRVMYQKNAVLFPGDNAPSNSPMQVDLSGLKAVLQVGYNF